MNADEIRFIDSMDVRLRGMKTAHQAGFTPPTHDVSSRCEIMLMSVERLS